MNIAANLEPHDRKQLAADPDFSAIYQYLVALLKGFDPPDLKAIGWLSIYICSVLFHSFSPRLPLE